MPRSVADYVRKWKPASDDGYSEHEDITPESTLIFQTARSTPMGEGIWPMPDFGDAICFFRYYEIPKELDPGPSIQGLEDMAASLPGFAMMLYAWNQRKPSFTTEQVLARKSTANEALDALLDEYVRDGYQPDMPDRLGEIANAALTDFEVERFWVLPGDLLELLKFTGNPLTDHFPYDDEADEQAAEARAPVFDLNNAEHRAALKERIWEMFL